MTLKEIQKLENEIKPILLSKLMDHLNKPEVIVRIIEELDVQLSLEKAKAGFYVFPNNPYIIIGAFNQTEDRIKVESIHWEVSVTIKDRVPGGQIHSSIADHLIGEISNIEFQELNELMDFDIEVSFECRKGK